LRDVQRHDRSFNPSPRGNVERDGSTRRMATVTDDTPRPQPQLLRRRKRRNVRRLHCPWPNRTIAVKLRLATFPPAPVTMFRQRLLTFFLDVLAARLESFLNFFGKYLESCYSCSGSESSTYTRSQNLDGTRQKKLSSSPTSLTSNTTASKIARA
jgi:hypothetical protein